MIKNRLSCRTIFDCPTIFLFLLITAAVGIVQECVAQKNAELGAAERERLINEICRKIEELYPFPEIASTTIAGIRNRYTAKAYDGATSPKEFASLITSDMEYLSEDVHMDLYYDPELASELSARLESNDAQSGPMPVQIENAQWENFGFKEIHFLDGRIGYLDIRSFFAAKHAGHIAVAAMNILSGSNALIIDLRRNGGGWDDMVMLLASYFIDVKEAEVIALSRSTLDREYYASLLSAYVPGKKFVDKPVYILIGPSTASAAEAFTSILRHFNGNVVLVGETTAGAENPVEVIPLGGGFVLKIPCYEKIFFGTRPGWQNTGLHPDIKASSDLALETAHLHALRALQDGMKDELAREKIRWAIDGLNALTVNATVRHSTLESYVGEYEDARVFLEHDLYLQFGSGQSRRLIAISDEYFLVEGRDDLRLRFIVGPDGATGFMRIYSDGYNALHPRK